MKKTWLLLPGILLVGAVLASGCTAKQVRDGDTIKVHYTLTLEDGTVYYTSAGGEPLEYTLGQGALLPGFEEAVVGMKIGDTKTVALPVEQAYGPYRPELVLTVSRSELPEGLEPEVGQQLRTETESGSPLVMVVTEVTDTMVTLDANHPLSGRNLTFDIELVAIGENVAAGNSARLTSLSGWLLAPVALALAVGLALVYFRIRRRPARGSPARRSERLLAELARLDDDFEGGRIAKAAYRQARKQKKAQLVRLMHRAVRESGH